MSLDSCHESGLMKSNIHKKTILKDGMDLHKNTEYY